MIKKNYLVITGFSVYFLFILTSLLIGFAPGREVGVAFYSFGLQMIKILPCAFILIGLFEVWVHSETIEKHLGEDSGLKGYIWALLLASTVVGGLYVSFPLAYSLYKKGAKLGVIFTYISASAVCRIPMGIFEASFMGIRYTVIRLLISLPLIIVTSVFLGRYLNKHGYKISKGS